MRAWHADPLMRIRKLKSLARCSFGLATLPEFWELTSPYQKVPRILTRLGFGVRRTTGATLSIAVPFWRRADMAEEGGAGVVEEIARIHGYASLPRQSIRGAVPAVHAPESFAWERSAKHFLSARGFHECMSYSLVSEIVIKKKRFYCVGLHPRP